MRQNRNLKPKVLGPYTEADLKNWNDGLAKCEEAMRLCELSIQAGLPCQDDLAACTAVRDQLAQIKATFAPGYP